MATSKSVEPSLKKKSQTQKHGVQLLIVQTIKVQIRNSVSTDFRPTQLGTVSCFTCHKSLFTLFCMFKFIKIQKLHKLKIMYYRSKEWVNLCRRADLMGKTTKYLRNNCKLCSNRFEERMFYRDLRNCLKSDAKPTLFEIASPPPAVCSKRRRLQREQLLLALQVI